MYNIRTHKFSLSNCGLHMQEKDKLNTHNIQWKIMSAAFGITIGKTW